jgi:ADP-L-glycero-D-manno-heptose 6-epimerase
MDKSAAIIVTGAAGFIGSCMVGYLNANGYNNIIIVDDFTEDEKKPNYINKTFRVSVPREKLFDWLNADSTGTNGKRIGFVFHLGARTDTTEFDYSIHDALNVQYSKKIWNYCSAKKIPLIYASSAATYGAGHFGYKDDHSIIEKLEPLNPYGVSKNEFDKWAIAQAPNKQPPLWAGLKFFNVYGPNEYHKGRMASVVFHSFNQIKKAGKVRLFKSHDPKYEDGEQLRDFIYVDDVLKIMYWMMHEMVNKQWPAQKNGVYNVGTGKARTFKDLALAIFNSMDLKAHIEYIDTPADIRDKYQYFTEADMNKLRHAGYNESFFSLEHGIRHYVKNFLLAHKYYSPQ